MYFIECLVINFSNSFKNDEPLGRATWRSSAMRGSVPLVASTITMISGVRGATEPGIQLSLKPQHLKLSPHTLRYTHGYPIIQAGGYLGDVAEGLGSRLDQVFGRICQAGSGRKRGAT